MTDRLLKKRDIAAIFQTSAERAAVILREHGVNGFTLGNGRGLGFRWLESAVMSVVHALAAESVPAPTKDKPKRKRAKNIIDVPLYSLDAKAILELTRPSIVQ